MHAVDRVEPVTVRITRGIRVAAVGGLPKVRKEIIILLIERVDAVTYVTSRGIRVAVVGGFP